MRQILIKITPNYKKTPSYKMSLFTYLHKNFKSGGLLVNGTREDARSIVRSLRDRSFATMTTRNLSGDNQLFFKGSRELLSMLIAKSSKISSFSIFVDYKEEIDEYDKKIALASKILGFVYLVVSPNGSHHYMLKQFNSHTKLDYEYYKIKDTKDFNRKIEKELSEHKYPSRSLIVTSSRADTHDLMKKLENRSKVKVVNGEIYHGGQSEKGPITVVTHKITDRLRGSSFDFIYIRSDLLSFNKNGVGEFVTRCGNEINAIAELLYDKKNQKVIIFGTSKVPEIPDYYRTVEVIGDKIYDCILTIIINDKSDFFSLMQIEEEDLIYLTELDFLTPPTNSGIYTKMLTNIGWEAYGYSTNPFSGLFLYYWCSLYSQLNYYFPALVIASYIEASPTILQFQDFLHIWRSIIEKIDFQKIDTARELVDAIYWPEMRSIIYLVSQKMNKYQTKIEKFTEKGAIKRITPIFTMIFNKDPFMVARESEEGWTIDEGREELLPVVSDQLNVENAVVLKGIHYGDEYEALIVLPGMAVEKPTLEIEFPKMPKDFSLETKLEVKELTTLNIIDKSPKITQLIKTVESF